MRKFNKLTRRGKLRRIFFETKKRLSRMWGDYQRGGIRGAYHWVRCHVWNRYHVINISRHSDGYRWGWIDRDYAMLLACFGLLCDYVEQEDPEVGTRTLESYGAREWPGEDAALRAQIEADNEIRLLYLWWKFVRPAEHAAPGYDYKVRERLDARDEEMLQRLMKVRTRLWT